MSKKPWLKSIITGALLGGLILGSVGIVYADSSTTTTSDSSSTATIQNKMHKDKGMGMDLDLATLVSDGVITSDESTAIQAKIDELEASRKAEMEKIKAMTDTEREAYFKANKTTDTEKTDLLTTLVNDSIISSDTATAIRTAMQEQRQTEQKTRVTEKLAALVTAGTITQDQSDAILTAWQTAQTARQAEMDKVKAMTDTEREAYFKANTTEKDSFLADLVTAGTITQTEADAVQTAIGGSRGNDKGDKVQSESGQTKVTEKLAALVTAGTITQDQSDAILTAWQTEQTARQAEMDKVKAMTDTEREAYFKANTTKKDSFLADMVTAGTITQAEADAVQTAIFGSKGNDKGGPNGSEKGAPCEGMAK